MTTGNVEIGTISGTDLYSGKFWTGADGRTTDNAYECTILTRRHSKSRQLPPWHTLPAAYYANCTVVPASPWTANDTIKLQAKLADKMRGHDFNLGVAVAEGRETTALVANTVKAFGKSLLSLKRGNISEALRHLGHAPAGKRQSASVLAKKDISSQWLAISYGWVPLLNDVYEAAKAFEVLTAPPRVARLTVHHEVRAKQECSASPSSYKAPGNRIVSKRLTVVVTENTTSAPRSLGLHDPLKIAWEAVPFSFVADWFIPVGDYLNAVSSSPPFIDLKARLGEKDSLVSYTNGSLMIGFTGLDPVGFSDQFQRIQVKRTPGYSVSTPPPKFKDLSDVYSTQRALNAVALAHQLFT